MPTVNTKTCRCCKNTLLITKFYKIKTVVFDYACKKCRSVLNKEKYIRNSEKLIQYSKKYRLQNPEKIIETRKKTNKKYAEVLKKRNNTEKAKFFKKRWKENNKDKILADRAKRRAIEKKAYPVWARTLFDKEILQFYSDSKYLKNLTKEVFHVDHIVPLVHTNVCGLHVPWNLQILTAQENYDKNNKFYVPEVKE